MTDAKNARSLGRDVASSGDMVSGFKFVHAADLHLGSPFHGLSLRDAALARRFAESSRLAFTALVTRAIAERVAFVVIAGDVYDGDWRDNSIGLYFNRELARLDRAGIGVFLLKGNHDAESVVTRSVTLPASVRHFGTETASSFRIERLKVALHGQGFRERAVTENLVLNYPSQVAGYFNIGVLHTALGRPEHDNYAPATAGHLRARGYDYWALGHIHEFEVLQKRPYIVFPGNLQGRHMGEQGPKGAVLVTVADGEVTALDRIIVDHARWLELKVDAAGETSEAALLKLIEEQVRPIGAEAAERLIALRVTLVGETELHARLVTHREQLTDEVQAACQRVNGDIWLERLDIRTKAVRAPARAKSALATVDLAALLAEVGAGEELGDRAGKLIADLRARIPGTIPEREQDLAAELPQLIAEARDLLLTRAAGDT